MRMILGSALMVILSAGVSAEDKVEKVDASKVVGKWEPKDAPKGMKVVIEFTKDGKILITTGKKDEDFGGTYKVEGNKIKITLKLGDMEIKDDLTVSKQSDTELIFKKGDSDKLEGLVRIKDK
jgi:uncharacterized protein (TIGR03066 family)